MENKAIEEALKIFQEDEDRGLLPKGYTQKMRRRMYGNS